MNKYIAITIGDINGIGIQLYLDLIKKIKNNNFILFTNYDILNNYLKKNNFKFKINLINKITNQIDFHKGKLNIYSYKSKNFYENTYYSLTYSYKICIKFNFLGIVTLPLRKDLMIKNIDTNFVGQTEFFQKIDKKEISNMILFHNKLIISPLTNHKAVNSISKSIRKKNYLYFKIISLNNSLKKDFNIKNPKILVSGFNPHAGENGNLGNEEIKVIIPTIKKLQKKGVDATGPISPDSMLINKNISKYDCFAFIYHDQALIPFKYISQFTGINFTSNLNIIRVSPDHGTAYDLKGKSKISNKSLINCFKFIKKVSKNRNINASKKIFKSKFYL